MGRLRTDTPSQTSWTAQHPQWARWERRVEGLLVSHHPLRKATLNLSFLICTDHSKALPFTIYSFGRFLWNPPYPRHVLGVRKEDKPK